MLFHDVTSIACDYCETRVLVPGAASHSAEAAREWASGKGWLKMGLQEPIHDMCPKCQTGDKDLKRIDRKERL